MRLFIAINLSEEAKNTIKEAVDKIKPPFDDYSARFLSPKNWHLTVTFLGYQPPEALAPIRESIRETASDFNRVRIDFKNIVYGPPDKSARMIWLTGDEKTSEKLNELKISLEKTLVANGVKFKQENRIFNAHLTLARFGNPLGKLPDYLIAPLFLRFEAETLDLMESRLKRNGAEYEKISEFAFKSPVL